MVRSQQATATATATLLFTATLWVHSISVVLFRVSDFRSISKNRCNSGGFCTQFLTAVFQVGAKIAVAIAVAQCKRTFRVW